MNRKHFWIWGPPLISAAIAISLLQRFVDTQVTTLEIKASSRIAQKNMLWAKQGYTNVDSALKSAWAMDTLAPVSPFHPSSRGAGGSTAAAQAQSSPIVRPNLILKGTVGNQVATLVNGMGSKMIVRVGEKIDSAVVIRIGPGKVTLKDRHGLFEIESEP